ncbi:MAG: hypothetical protein LBV58_00195 [Acholeplasmatales bacterium]|jgi:cellobiose phosphorylase|nr:hypothetical protein [Acholeplasmatales bacterium]
MIKTTKPKLKTIKNEKLAISFLETGDIFDINADKMINLYQGNEIDGCLINIYLRIIETDRIIYSPLIGINSNSSFGISNNTAHYKGIFNNLKYELNIILDNDLIVYDLNIINLDKNKNFTIDLVHTIDVGISDQNAIFNNAAYVSQYIDHEIYLTKENGYRIINRENQGTSLLMVGSINKEINSFSTDGYKFYGKTYKETRSATSLTSINLDNLIYQYELSFNAIKTIPFIIEDSESVQFFNKYYSNKKDFNDYETKIIYKNIRTLELPIYNKVTKKKVIPLNGELVNDSKLNELYPRRNLEELSESNSILSFFTPHKTHVVLKEKELLQERPTSTITIDQGYFNGLETSSFTSFMYGIFASHQTIGNTSFNKSLSISREGLNLFSIQGLRIYIKEKETLKLLNMPSLFEIGFNFTKYIYITDSDTITVKIWTPLYSNAFKLTLSSTLCHDFYLTMQYELSDKPYQCDYNLEIKDNMFEISPANNSFITDKYSELNFKYYFNEDATIGRDEFLFENKYFDTIISLNYKNTNDFYLISTSSTKKEIKNINFDFSEDIFTYYNFLKSKLNFFKITNSQNENETLKLNTILYWYFHNALIHYTSPHGLEQFSGAAYGTRDLSQGPFELFLSLNNFEETKKIIKTIYRNQFTQTYDWPQWFMFDKFYSIRASDSHGDVIIWPIKCLGEYLKRTKDLSILDEKLPYYSKTLNNYTDDTESIYNHLIKQIDVIVSSFIGDISLPKYLGGDWDDTLQPANKELAKDMVSGWTPLLLFESLSLLSKELTTYNKKFAYYISNLALQIERDYKLHILIDNTPAGFLIYKNNSLLLHPKDDKTNIKYRLLPHTRGIISELFDRDIIDHILENIDQNLTFKDGIRLMDINAKYLRGEKTYFQRAETSANFGREVGLLYTHAQIRYIEAMLKLGLPERAIDIINKSNPIQIKNVVPNSEPRQSNMYFSSSDGAFNNRYEAYENFNKLKDGRVYVKGGWRLYSSGPGIFINQIISNFFGIRLLHNDLVLDPVLPNEYVDVTLSFIVLGLKISITYKKDTNNYILINNKRYLLDTLKNKYRDSGFLIPFEKLRDNTSIIYYSNKFK